MAKVELRRKGGSTLSIDLERIPVAGDYVTAGGLGRVLAVVLTPQSGHAAVAFVVKDMDGWPDEVLSAFG